MSDTAVLKENERRRAEKLAAWRKTQRKTVTLAGLEVELRVRTVMDLVASGAIPPDLEQIADEYVNGKTEAAIADYPKFAPLVAAVARACIVEPPVADVEDETHIAFSEIHEEDRLKIFQWANGAANAFDANQVIAAVEEQEAAATMAHVAEVVADAQAQDVGEVLMLDVAA